MSSTIQPPKPIHGEKIPFHVSHGLEATPPVPCAFKIGDKVIFTNDYGLEFNQIVTGFAREVQSWGGFIHLGENAPWWCPVRPESLRLA